MKRLLRWAFNLAAAVSVAACLLWARSFFDGRFGVHFWHGRTRVFVVATADSLDAAKAEWRDYFPYNFELDARNTWKLLHDYGTYGLRPSTARPLGYGLPLVEYTDAHGRYWLADLPPSAGALPPALLAAAWGAASAFARLRRRFRARRSLCPSCGYNLRATPGRCPECGHVPAGKVAT